MRELKRTIFLKSSLCVNVLIETFSEGAQQAVLKDVKFNV